MVDWTHSASRNNDLKLKDTDQPPSWMNNITYPERNQNEKLLISSSQNKTKPECVNTHYMTSLVNTVRIRTEVSIWTFLRVGISQVWSSA